MRTVLYLSAAQYLSRSIQGLRDAGFRVVTVDRDPSAPGSKFAHRHIAASIDDVRAVQHAAVAVHADVILPGIEAGVLSAAIASDALGLPNIGSEIARRCLDKGFMRQAWRRAGLAQPDFRLVEHREQMRAAISEFGLPLVVKPRCCNGSKGVSVVHDNRDIDVAIDDAAAHENGGGFIIERFVEGPLLTADGLVDSKRVVVAAVGDVETQATSRFRVNMALSYPANYSADIVAEGEALITNAVRALDLKNSAFHCECIVSDNGPVLVELGARSGGSFIGSVVVPAVSGLVPSVVSAKMLLGDPVDLTPRRLGGASLTFLSAPQGLLREVKGFEHASSLPGVVEIGVTLPVGSQGGLVASDNARHGYVVTMGATRNEAVERAAAARKAVTFEMV
jgi:biotin carboxylase